MTPAYLTAPTCEDVCCDRSMARCTACRGTPPLAQLDRAAYAARAAYTSACDALAAARDSSDAAAAISEALAAVRDAAARAHAASDAARDARDSAFAARVSSVDPGAPATPGAAELTPRND